MGRKPDTSIREELLKQSVNYCISEGYRAFSLRALADKLGTSHRMLIYHFKSSEELFEAVLEKLRSRSLARFDEAFSAVNDVPGFKSTTKKVWRQLASEQSRPFMLSYLEIQVMEIRDGKSRASSTYLDATLEEWLAPLISTLVRLNYSKQDSRIKARIMLSGGRGLILDWLGAGSASDRRQIYASFDCMVDSLFE